MFLYLPERKNIMDNAKFWEYGEVPIPQLFIHEHQAIENIKTLNRFLKEDWKIYSIVSELTNTTVLVKIKRRMR